MRPDPITVFVVEDHPAVRDSLAALLDVSDGLELWGTAESGRDALDQLGQAGDRALPTVALVDLSMPGMDGIELIGLLHEAWPALACVVLSAHRAAVYSGRAQEAGARGYVEKGNLGVLVDVLRDVGEGRHTWAAQPGGRSGGFVR